MRVMLGVHQFFPQYYAGTEVLTLNTALALRRRGHEVRIFTGFPGSDPGGGARYFDRYQYEGLTVDRYFCSKEDPLVSKNSFKATYDNQRAAKGFEESVSAFQPDVVHFFQLQRISARTVDICRRHFLPMMFTATDYWLLCPTHQLFLPDNTICKGPEKIPANCLKHLCRVSQSAAVKRAADFIPDSFIKTGLRIIPKLHRLPIKQLAMTQALMDRDRFLRDRIGYIDKVTVPTLFMASVLGDWGIQSQKIVHLPFAVKEEIARSATEKGRKASLRIGFIGTLINSKGAHVLLSAVKSMGKAFPVTLHIYGDLNQFPDYTRELRSIAGDDPRIFFKGTFPHDRIGAVLDQMDLLVVPSLWHENTPLVIHSAQQAGVPVVASNVSGVAEIIHHEENGMIFERGDSAGLAGVLSRLNDERDLLQRLVKNSKPIGSMEGYVDNLLTLYRELVSARSNHNGHADLRAGGPEWI